MVCVIVNAFPSDWFWASPLMNWFLLLKFQFFIYICIYFVCFHQVNGSCGATWYKYKNQHFLMLFIQALFGLDTVMSWHLNSCVFSNTGFGDTSKEIFMILEFNMFTWNGQYTPITENQNLLHGFSKKCARLTCTYPLPQNTVSGRARCDELQATYLNLFVAFRYTQTRIYIYNIYV